MDKVFKSNKHKLSDTSAHMLKGSCIWHFKKSLHPILYRNCNLRFNAADSKNIQFVSLLKTAKREGRLFVTVKMYKVFILVLK